MANLKAMKNRITSVKSTQKITKAMKMVAAAKLRRAQESLLRARPYSNRLRRVIANVARRTDAEKHPLLQQNRQGERALCVVISADRGLCGGFNGAIIKQLTAFLQEEQADLIFIGKKAHNFFKGKSGITIIKDYGELLDDISFDASKEVAEEVISRYDSGSYRSTFLIYNEFKSAISQNVMVEQVLPLIPAEDLLMPDVPYVFEPSEDQVLDHVLKLYFSTEIYRVLLESSAAEHGARMTAMEAATNNADEMIEHLTLSYNRARQAAITTELIEVISGSEALK